MKKGLLLGLPMAVAGATGAFAQEGVTPDSVLKINDRLPVTTVVNATSAISEEVAKTISFDDATRLMDEGKGLDLNQDLDGQYIDEYEISERDSLVDKKQTNKGRINVHGMLGMGTGVAGDAAEVCSDKLTLTAVVDVSGGKTLLLGFRTIRLDNFDNNPNYPFGRTTVLTPYATKNFGENGKFKVSLEGKYTASDQMPQANTFSPDLVLSYTTDGGRTFEGMYAHKFKSGADSDAFRLTVAKKINDALKITGQGWYETKYDKHFYGRIILDVYLGNGLCAQLSCIRKHGKLTPTAGILYQF